MAKNRFRDQARNGQSIRLTEEEQGPVRNLEQALIDAKCRAADAYSRFANEISVCNQLQSTFNGRIRELAITHGIAVDDPAAGKWNFTTKTMAFEKVA
jgi:hypothetical protein